MFHEISHDGKLGKFRWTSLYVYQLDTVLESFQISNVLDSVYDRRMTKIDNLPKNQMIDKCKSLGINHYGNKVKFSTSMTYIWP